MAIEFGTESAFTSAQIRYASVTKLNSTQFVVAYNNDADANNKGSCIVGVYSGTTISSYGTEADFTANTVTRTAICRLDDTHFVIAYRDNDDTSDGKAVVCSVSGTTITVGTPSTYTSSTSNAESLVALDSSTFVVGYEDGTSGASVRVGNVSGTTISSWGTAKQVQAQSTFTALDLMDTNKIIIATSAYNDATGVAKATVGTISSGTVTLGSSVNLLDGNNAYAFAIRKLDTDKFLFAGLDTDDNDGVVVCGTISGTTVDSVGTPVVYNSGAPAGTGIAILDSSTAILTSDNSPNSTDISISGTTITLGDAVAYNSGSTATNDTSNISFELSDTTFVNVFEDVANSEYGTAIIGEFASASAAADNSIFFGTNF